MHGLTGGSWKRNHDQATATEKNNPTGNRRDHNGSVPYRRSRSPRQLSTLHRSSPDALTGGSAPVLSSRKFTVVGQGLSHSPSSMPEEKP